MTPQLHIDRFCITFDPFSARDLFVRAIREHGEVVLRRESSALPCSV